MRLRAGEADKRQGQDCVHHQPSQGKPTLRHCVERAEDKQDRHNNRSLEDGRLGERITPVGMEIRFRRVSQKQEDGEEQECQQGQRHEDVEATSIGATEDLSAE
jgi:hypothetical protein